MLPAAHRHPGGRRPAKTVPPPAAAGGPSRVPPPLHPSGYSSFSITTLISADTSASTRTGPSPGTASGSITPPSTATRTPSPPSGKPSGSTGTTPTPGTCSVSRTPARATDSPRWSASSHCDASIRHGPTRCSAWSGRADGYTLAVQELADRLRLPMDQLKDPLATLEAQPRMPRELLLRRFVEAWLKDQREAYRDQRAGAGENRRVEEHGVSSRSRVSGDVMLEGECTWRPGRALTKTEQYEQEHRRQNQRRDNQRLHPVRSFE